MGAIYMMGLANAVIPFDGVPRTLIGQILPDVRILGWDQEDDGYIKPLTIRVPQLHGYSTTQILQSHATP